MLSKRMATFWYTGQQLHQNINREFPPGTWSMWIAEGRWVNLSGIPYDEARGGTPLLQLAQDTPVYRLEKHSGLIQLLLN